MPVLNLTDREDAGFDPLPAGRYRASVYDAEERYTGGGGKLPEGTAMIWIQWKIEEPLFPYPEVGSEDDAGIKVPNWENKYQFSQNVVPPQEINGEPYKNYKMMNGIIFRLLESLGYTEEQLNSGSFELDYEDLKGREAAITVSRYTYTDPDTGEKDIRNNVKGVKAAPASSGVL
jgi:hypothetical protein